MEQTTAPYGSWVSCISSEIVSSKTVRFSGIAIQNERVYWAEQRPAEKGRTTLLQSDMQGSIEEILPSKFNARTRVHEYGGVPFVLQKDALFFYNDDDQGLYLLVKDKKPQKIAHTKKCRYADAFYDEAKEIVYAVREDHREEAVQNTIVSIHIPTQEENVVVEGCDFYSNPQISPDGKYLSYLCWNHPNMPWDATKLMVHSIHEERIAKDGIVIAGSAEESIFQPKWSKNNILYFISDRTGFWNLYRLKEEKIEPLWEKKAEFGLPQWIFGFSTYDFIDDQHIVCTFFEKGRQCLGIFHVEEHAWKKIESPFHFFHYIKSDGKKIAFVGSSPILPSCIAIYHLDTQEMKIIKSSWEESIDADYISVGEFIEYSTVGGNKAYAFYYPPTNRDFQPPENELPPLLVKCHGGPSSFSDNSLNMQVQYWTSRGFAFVDVNYGGSTGFGREYRERLKGKWGIVDVQDSAKAVEYLVNQKLANPSKIAIRGGSAGGYTVLASLTFTKLFKAGASYYGVSDLEALAKDTHKFESHYLEKLIGPYPEKKDVYVKRSPINFVNNLSCPIIFLQGGEDKVVPPDQAEKMFLALKEKKITTAYILFKNEQHGFRKAENIKKALEAELYFYSRVFQFLPVEDLKPIRIEN